MNFTASQKKWALTASLASVLSFNVVMSLGYQDFGAASLASRTLSDDENDHFEKLKEEARDKAQKEADDKADLRKRETSVKGEGVKKCATLKSTTKKNKYCS